MHKLTNIVVCRNESGGSCLDERAASDLAVLVGRGEDRTASGVPDADHSGFGRGAEQQGDGGPAGDAPGDGPQPCAVYVDETDVVWVSDWAANAILRFDPRTEKFESFPLHDPYASVRQLAGRKGEIWGAESGADKLFVLRAE